MRMVMVSVRDVKSELYGRPFFVRTSGEAIRSFMDEVNRNEKDNMMAAHPSDFALYEIGLFDDAEGKIYGYDIPKLLLQADQVKDKNAIPQGVTAY